MQCTQRANGSVWRLPLPAAPSSAGLGSPQTACTPCSAFLTAASMRPCNAASPSRCTTSRPKESTRIRRAAVASMPRELRACDDGGWMWGARDRNRLAAPPGNRRILGGERHDHPQAREQVERGISTWCDLASTPAAPPPLHPRNHSPSHTSGKTAGPPPGQRWRRRGCT